MNIFLSNLACIYLSIAEYFDWFSFALLISCLSSCKTHILTNQSNRSRIRRDAVACYSKAITRDMG